MKLALMGKDDWFGDVAGFQYRTDVPHEPDDNQTYEPNLDDESDLDDEPSENVIVAPWPAADAK